MCFLVCTYWLNTEDPSALGRMNLSLLPQQTLMELFIEKANLYPIGAVTYGRGYKPTYNDLSKWTCVKLNARAEVALACFRFHSWNSDTCALDFHLLPPTIEHLEIRFMCTDISWSDDSNFSLTGLPENLKSLEMPGAKAVGTLETSRLPGGLECIDLHENAFHGKMSIADLPLTLKSLLLNSNRLTGSLEFPALPPKIVYVHLQKNLFSGAINLLRLPQTLESLNISENQLSGNLMVRNVVTTLEEFEIFTNRFTGICDLSGLPPKRIHDYDDPKSYHSMGVSLDNNCLEGIDWDTVSPRIERIDANINALRGPLQSHQLPRHLQVLKVSTNMYDGSLDLHGLPEPLRWLDASHNHLSGELDFTVLSERMRNLNLAGNAFVGPVDLTRLPARFRHLNVSSNRLNGPVSFGNLPDPLKSIDLSNNYITQDRMEVKRIPKNLVLVDFRGNDVHVQGESINTVFRFDEMKE